MCVPHRPVPQPEIEHAQPALPAQIDDALAQDLRNPVAEIIDEPMIEMGGEVVEHGARVSRRRAAGGDAFGGVEKMAKRFGLDIRGDGLAVTLRGFVPLRPGFRTAGRD